MSKSLIPYEPIFVPKPVDEDVWIVDGSVIRFRMGLLRAPFTTRMTIIRLSGDELWLHSPVQADRDLLDQVEALGRVRYLVAPNPIHYWWIADWNSQFPGAQVYAVDRLEKRARRPIPAFQTLRPEPPAEWDGQFGQILVEDGWFSEAVFFHRASRTLVLADLIENFEPAHVRSWVYRLLLRIGGVAHPDGAMPRDMRLAFRRHRPQLKRAVEQMIAWEPARIILAHGRWYDRDCVAELRRAFRWLL